MNPWTAIERLQKEIQTCVANLEFNKAAEVRKTLDNLKKAQIKELDNQWSLPPYSKNRLSY